MAKGSDRKIIDLVPRNGTNGHTNGSPNGTNGHSAAVDQWKRWASPEAAQQRRAERAMSPQQLEAMQRAQAQYEATMDSVRRHQAARMGVPVSAIPPPNGVNGAANVPPAESGEAPPTGGEPVPGAPILVRRPSRKGAYVALGVAGALGLGTFALLALRGRSGSSRALVPIEGDDEGDDSEA